MLLLLVFLLILLFRFFELTVEALEDVVESLDGALLLPFTLWWLLLLLLTIGFVDDVDVGAANAVFFSPSFWLCFSNANRNREEKRRTKWEFSKEFEIWFWQWSRSAKRNINNVWAFFFSSLLSTQFFDPNKFDAIDYRFTFARFFHNFFFFFLFLVFFILLLFLLPFIFCSHLMLVLILFGKLIADREFIIFCKITIFSNWLGWRWFFQCRTIICRGHVFIYAVIIIIRYTDHNTTANFLVWIIIFIIIIIIDLMSGYNWCYQITCRWWCIACAHNWWRWNRVDFLHFRFYQILSRRTKL